MSAAFPIPRATRRIDITATAGQTAFTFPFPTLENEDVSVALQVSGNTYFTRLTYGVDFIVTGAPSSSSVTVTLITPAAANDVYRLAGARVPRRTTDFAPAGSQFRPSLSTELDNFTLIMQELRAYADRIEEYLNGGVTGLASQVEAEAGVINSANMSPLRVKQAVQNGSFFVPTVLGSSAHSFTRKMRTFASLSDFVGSDTLNFDGINDDSVIWQRAAASGVTVFLPPGQSKINAPVKFASNTAFFSPSRQTTIVIGSGVALTRGVFENVNDNTAVQGLRTDSNILIYGLKFDGVARRYPTYLEDGSGNAVTNPGQDPTRNTSTYTTTGYVISFVCAAEVHVRACEFVDHGSFAVRLSGCLQGTVDDCKFFRCGRAAFSSNAIVVNHYGTFRQVTGVTQGADTTFDLTSANAAVTGAGQVYIANVRGLSNLITNGVYAVKSSTSTSITIENDTSAADGFVFTGRAWIGTDITTFSEHCSVTNCRGFSLDRALMQIGGASFTHISGAMGRNLKESGVYLICAFDTTIEGVLIENVDIADIVSAGLEINLCVNVRLKNCIIRNTQNNSINVVGCIGLDIDGLTIIDPIDTPGLLGPYGPFAETTSAFNQSVTTTASNPDILMADTSAFATDMMIVSPAFPAGTTILSITPGVKLVMSVNATLSTTQTARFIPAGRPAGRVLDTYKRYGILLQETQGFPVTDFSIKGRIIDTIRNTVGAIYATGTAGTIKNGDIDLQTDRLGRRGKVTGISRAALGVVTTETAHGLINNQSIYLRDIAGMTGANGGSYLVTVLTPTTFQINLNTSAMPPFVATEFAKWGTADPANDLTNNLNVIDLNTVRIARDRAYKDGTTDSAGRTWVTNPVTGRRALVPGSNLRRMDATVAGTSSTIINLVGQTTATSDGTATAATIAATSKYTRTPRLRSPSAASTGANSGHRFGDFRYLADPGTVAITFGWEQFQTNAAAFVGLKASGAHGNVDPSTFINAIGVGIDAGQTTWRLLHNDGAGACTATDLGSAFPANSSATDLYELTLWWDAAATAVNWQVANLSSGAMAKGTISTNLPDTATALNTHVIANTRTGAAAVDLAFSQIYGTAA